MSEQLMYRNKAEFYDLIYSFKDYEAETKKHLQLIKKYKKNKGKELLEVACGTGKFLTHFKKHFNCSGVDINKGILDVAKKKHPQLRFYKQDMSKLKLKQKFDVIVCLFSSIGYLQTKKELQEAFKRFATHLNEGGVLIVEPWIGKKDLKQGYAHMLTYEDEDIKLCRMNVAKVKNGKSYINFHWLMARSGGKVEHFTDLHILRSTSSQEFIEIGKKSGLRVKILKGKEFKRDLVVAVK